MPLLRDGARTSSGLMHDHGSKENGVGMIHSGRVQQPSRSAMCQSPRPKRARSVEDSRLVAGKEAVGFKIRVVDARGTVGERASVQDFNEADCTHKLRFGERGARRETWCCLATMRWQWDGDGPSSPNPTFQQGLTPMKDAAVKHRVKVFWPAQGKWYVGKVVGYDSRTGEHSVDYTDGTRDHKIRLRQSAVLWLDIPELARGRDPVMSDQESSGSAVKRVARGRVQVPLGDRPSNITSAANVTPSHARTPPAASPRCKIPKAPLVSGTRPHHPRPVADNFERPLPARARKACTPQPDLDDDESFPESVTAASLPCTPVGVAVLSADSPGGQSSTVCEDLTMDLRMMEAPCTVAMTVPMPQTRAPLRLPTAAAATKSSPLECSQCTSTVTNLPNWHLPASGRGPPPLPEGGEEVSVKNEPSAVEEGRSATAESGPPLVKLEEVQPFPAIAPAARPSLAPPAVIPPCPLLRCDLGRARCAKLRKESSGPGSPEPREAPSGPLGPRPLRGGAPRGRGTTRGGVRRARKVRRRSGSESDLDPTPSRGDARNAFSATVGCRVAIYWRDDDAYYTGEIVRCDSWMFHVLYDDGEAEWLSLQDESFKWLTPRGGSAGATDEKIVEAMNSLHAENLAASGPAPMVGLVPGGSPPPPVRSDSTVALPRASAGHPVAGGDTIMLPETTGLGAVGRRINLRSPGDGREYVGEVIAFDEQDNRHVVLFEDGEHEKLDLTKEEILWEGLARKQPFAAGMAGQAAPRGRPAVGWRIAVFCKSSMEFHRAEIVGYDNGTGKHKVLFEGDDVETCISVSTSKVKWLLAPGIGSSGGADSDDGRGRYRKKQRRPRRDGTAPLGQDLPAINVRRVRSERADGLPSTPACARLDHGRNGSLCLYPEDAQGQQPSSARTALALRNSLPLPVAAPVCRGLGELVLEREIEWDAEPYWLADLTEGARQATRQVLDSISGGHSRVTLRFYSSLLSKNPAEQPPQDEVEERDRMLDRVEAALPAMGQHPAASFDLMLESPRIRTPALSPRGALPLGPAAHVQPIGDIPHSTPPTYPSLDITDPAARLMRSPFADLRDGLRAGDAPPLTESGEKCPPQAVKLSMAVHQTSLGMDAVPETPSLCAEVRMGCCPSSSCGVPDSARSDAVGGAFSRGAHDVAVSPEPVVVV